MTPGNPDHKSRSSGPGTGHLRLAYSSEDDTAPPLLREAAFFRRCGLSRPDVGTALALARNNGTTVEAELMAARRLEPTVYYRFLAGRLGLPHLERIDPDSVVVSATVDVLLTRTGPLRILSGDRVLTVIVPEAQDLSGLAARLAAVPELKERLAIAAPSTIRAAVWQARASERVKATTDALFETRPIASAKVVMTGLQGYSLAALHLWLLAAVLLVPDLSLLLLHTAASLFFLSGHLLRLAAAFLGRRPARPVLPPSYPPGLPVYTVLVALRDEVAMIPQLVGGLDRLAWPKTRLDIKFVCEAIDQATIEALRAARLGPHCEIVEVPPYGPTTKPRALQYALSGARGEFVAIYDAEDIPDPAQLLEAWSLFRQADESLACVQSPLAIANFRRSWLTALFAVEYGGLFRALVPFLDRFGLPIPLGGTSNHFRRSALEAVGGWDPYNVTEDADLGFRLYRAGYRTRAAFHATIETAPETLGPWLNQRSRWLKGWLQTWLVLMRQPFAVCREFGLAGFAMIQVLIAGMLLATLAQPAMYAFVAWLGYRLWSGTYLPGGSAHALLLAVDAANILGSFAVFTLLGMSHLTRTERRGIALRSLAMVPVYWLAMSAAAWKALKQLPFRAHHWEKTPHPARLAEMRAARRQAEQGPSHERAGAGSGNRTRAFSLGS